MYVASKLPRHTGTSGWVAMLPARVPNPALEASITADIAVIGAGFAGLAAARQLTRRDPTLRIVVLEAGEIAEGPAGRNSGFMIDLPHDVSSGDYGGGAAGVERPDITVNRTAIGLAREMAQEHGWGPELFDPCGKYNVAMGEQGLQHIRSYSAQLDALNEPHRVLDADETAAVTGTRAFTAALFAPGSVIIQPAAYVRAFADVLKASKVRIFEKTPALSLASTAGGWTVGTSRGSVQAGRVILATNGHAQSFGFFRGRLLHVFTYASMSEEFEPGRLPGQRSWAATPAFPMGTTVRRVAGRTGDRLLIRSRYSYQAGIEVDEVDVARAGKVHDRKFADRFPMLAGLRMQYRWAGAMALTWNGVPAFGEIDRGLFAACACNGVGATKATASGIAAADAVLGLPSDLVHLFDGFSRPQRLPPQPFLAFGAKANLRVREWRAGVE